MIFAGEWRLFLSSRANIAILLALTLLIIVALQFGATRVIETQAAQAEAIAEAKSSWADRRAAFVDVSAGKREIGEYDDPRRADYVILGRTQAIALPPPPLALLSAGNVREGHGIVEVGMRPLDAAPDESRENPANRLDGPLDMAFIVAWLLPLIVILLAHDVLSGDRENGCASLLASQRQSLRRITATRLGVRFVALFTVIAIPTVVAILWVNRRVSGEVLADLALWLGAVALFLAFWLALAGLVNAKMKTGAKAALVLLGIWCGLALLVPAISNAVVTAQTPAPDRLGSILGVRAIESDLTERAAEVTEAYYKQNPARRPKRGPFDEYEEYFVGKYYPRLVALDRVLEPVAKQQNAMRVAQSEALRKWTFASPSLAIAVLTEDISGGAPEVATQFDSALRQFQRSWRDRFDVILASRTPLTLADYDEAPVADQEVINSRVGLSITLLPFAALMIALLLISAAAYRRLAKAQP